MPAISRTPSPRTFADAYREQVLRPAAQKLAGANVRISPGEARNAGRVLSGMDRLAADLFVQLSRELAAPASIDEFVAAAAARALSAAGQAAGPDGRLSGADKGRLPAQLQAAFDYLQTGQLPIAALRYSERVLRAVLSEHRLTDPGALLRRAVELAPGDAYLSRAELEAAARSLAGPTDAITAAMPATWRRALAGELDPAALSGLAEYVRAERARGPVFPPADEVFAALERTPLNRVKVVLLGQDPYHGPDEAHGLSFSVKPGVAVPPSLRNIFKELEADVGARVPNHGSLEQWADRGVLLLNTVLTVRQDQPGSHRGHGWEAVTDAILKKVNERDERVVFLLLGSDAQKKAALVDTTKHAVVRAAHPSPLSASRGFFGSKPFSKVNQALAEAGRAPIDWRLADR